MSFLLTKILVVVIILILVKQKIRIAEMKEELDYNEHRRHHLVVKVNDLEKELKRQKGYVKELYTFKHNTEYEQRRKSAFWSAS